MICYSERGEPSLSFEYKFVGHSWKLHKLYRSVHSYFSFFHTVLYCFHWEHQQVEGVRSAHGGSLRYEEIGQIQNWYAILKGDNLGFYLNIHFSAILENFTNYIQVYIHISFFLYTVLYCFHWEHQQVEGVRSAHGGSLRYEGIGQIQNWYAILKGDNLGFYLNIICRLFLKTSQIIPKCTFIFLFFSHCIVLFPLRAPASWRSAKCTRRLFKVWRNWPNSKLICYSERGEPSLSFEYKFVGHSWKLHKLYPSVHSYFFFSSHCIVLFPLRAPASWRSAKCTRKLFKVWRNWPNSTLICYSERGEPSLSFEYKFVGHSWKLHKLYRSVHSYFSFFHTVLYCFHWEHQQVEGVRSAHGGSLRYEEIGQIQNWYAILKGDNLGFYLNIHFSAILENFTNYIQVYIHISFFLYTVL